MSETTLPTVELRACGPCNRCCIDLRIFQPELAFGSACKPAGVPCPRLRGEPRLVLGGWEWCSRYDERPEECRGFECLWRFLGGDVLDVADRPDQVGVIFSIRMASELKLPLHEGEDWLVIAAVPCYVTHRSRPPGSCPSGARQIATDRYAMDAIRRLRTAGMTVLIDETATIGRRFLEGAMRPPTAAFLHRIEAAVNGRYGGPRSANATQGRTAQEQRESTNP